MWEVGAGDFCELWDVPSGKLIEMRESAGRVKLSSDSRFLTTVDAEGHLQVRRIYDDHVPSFWVGMAMSDPKALAALADVMPSYQLLLNTPLANGRLLVTHAVTASNRPLLNALFSSPTARPMPSCVLRDDATGRHALDFALDNRDAALSDLLLSQALRLPPHARTPLVESPRTRAARHEDVNRIHASSLFDRTTQSSSYGKATLVRVAQMFPHALAHQLSALGLDSYETSADGPGPVRRVHEECLTCDHGNMAVCGGAHPFEDEQIWQVLSGEKHGEDAQHGKARQGEAQHGEAQHGEMRLSMTTDMDLKSQVQLRTFAAASKAVVVAVKLLSSLRHPVIASKARRRSSVSGGSLRQMPRMSAAVRKFHELMDEAAETEEVEMQDVEVTYGVLGLPQLMTHGDAIDENEDIFLALLQASYECLSIMDTRVMRAAIAFKWQAFGRVMWLREVAILACFFATYIAGVHMLLGICNGDLTAAAVTIVGFDSTATQCEDSMWGWGLFFGASLLNVRYALLEIREWRAIGAAVYLSSPQNICDMALILNVFGLGVSLLLSSAWAPVLGSLGTVLMLPKMAAISRGASSFSMLVTILQEVVRAMVPFLSLMAFVVFASAFAFQILSQRSHERSDGVASQTGSDSPYTSFRNSWLASFALMLGEFDASTYQEDVWMFGFFHYFCVFVNVVLLNVLIAIISDCYERVLTTGAEHALQQRAELIMELEAHLSGSALEGSSAFYPRWVHVATRREVSVTSTWSGRIKAIQNAVRNVEQQVEEPETRVTDKLSADMQNLTAALSSLSERISDGGAPQKQRVQLPRPTAIPSPSYRAGPKRAIRPNVSSNAPRSAGLNQSVII